MFVKHAVGKVVIQQAPFVIYRGKDKGLHPFIPVGYYRHILPRMPWD